LLVLLYFAAGVPAQGEGEPATTPSATQPATTRSAGEAFSHFAANFAMLMADHWRSVAAFAALTVVNAVLWAVGMFLLGIGVGVAGYFLLRRLGLFAAPWSWYRWVRWLWCLLLAVSISIGFAVAGAWLGAGRNVKSYIRDKRMLDRIVVAVAMAAMLDRAGYEARGDETAEQIEKVLTDSEAAGREALADWSRFRREEAEAVTDNFLQRWLVELAIEAATEGFEDSPLRDPKLAWLMYTEGPCAEEYADKYPDANEGLVAASVFFGRIRGAACGLVDRAVYPNVWTAVGLGVGIPLGLAAVFRGILHLTYGRRARRAGT
jgi:hypothetical protein